MSYLFILFSLVVSLAHANDVAASAASVVMPGQWTTNPANCRGACREIRNVSRQNCVAFGFLNATVLENRLGFVAITDGGGNPLGVFIADGPDPDGQLDFVDCLPPGMSIYGSVQGLGTELDLETVYYQTGPTHYMVPDGRTAWGAYYPTTPITPIPAEGIMGNDEYYPMSTLVLYVGG